MTKELIILEEEMKQHSEEVIVMTDDGSSGEKRLGNGGNREVIQRKGRPLCHHWSSNRDEICGRTDQEVRGTHLRQPQYLLWWMVQVCAVPAVSR